MAEKVIAERVIPVSGNTTKSRILDVARELIAQKGFSAVSMRDIAKKVGIKMSSIYYYYEGKEALLEDILADFKSDYEGYFDWLTGENMKADSLETLMDTMFNKEFIEMRNPKACLGMSLIIKEQHNNNSVRDLALELFFDYSIRRLRADFDSLAQKGVIPPSDTKATAAVFMCCVLICNELRIHEYTGAKPPLACEAVYAGLKKMLSSALMRGVP